LLATEALARHRCRGCRRIGSARRPGPRLCGDPLWRTDLPANKFDDLELLLAAAPRTPILVAADCDDRARALAILRAGARGFLPTNLSLKVLLAALERLRAGGTYVPLVLTEPSGADFATETPAKPWCELTQRQRQVLTLIAEGLSNKKIAAALTTTESTVKAHVKEIIRRLNVANRTQAALLAARGGSPQGAAARAIVAV
jgi:DNA-binding NarL/FixJ family response regulator